MKLIFRPWRNVIAFNAAKHHARLKDRLKKFCVLDTPRNVLDKGEKWGDGQVEITLNDGTVWRGQIDSNKLPPDWVKAVQGAVLIHLELSWFAQKIRTRGLGKGDPILTTWIRDSDSLPYQLYLAMESFYQNKAGRRICSPIFFPKRLFFRTIKNENGFFSRDNDPENVSLGK